MSIPGSRWADVRPHGTLAAYRRHYRHGEQPCEDCRQANARASADRGREQANARRREQYRRLRDAGMTRDQIKGDRRAA